MEAYYLLYNLGSNDAIQHALLLPESVRLNPLVKLSMDINFAHINSNYVRLFRKISELPFLGCVAVMHHIRQLQRLKMIYQLMIFNFVLDEH